MKYLLYSEDPEKAIIIYSDKLKKEADNLFQKAIPVF